MTHPLLEWLLVELLEDERIALAAMEKAQPPWSNSNGLVRHSGPPEPDGGRDDGLWDDEGTSWMKVDHQLCMWEDVAEHVARHDPAVVLATVAAFRLIAELHGPVEAMYSSNDPNVCGTCGVDDSWYTVVWPCNTIRALASAFATRDGYDTDWGPT